MKRTYNPKKVKKSNEKRTYNKKLSIKEEIFEVVDKPKKKKKY